MHHKAGPVLIVIAALLVVYGANQTSHAPVDLIYQGAVYDVTYCGDNGCVDGPKCVTFDAYQQLALQAPAGYPGTSAAYDPKCGAGIPLNPECTDPTSPYYAPNSQFCLQLKSSTTTAISATTNPLPGQTMTTSTIAPPSITITQTAITQTTIQGTSTTSQTTVVPAACTNCKPPPLNPFILGGIGLGILGGIVTALPRVKSR